jgi:hypothetical protein
MKRLICSLLILAGLISASQLGAVGMVTHGPKVFTSSSSGSSGGGALVDGNYANITGSGFPDFSGVTFESIKRDMDLSSNGTALYNISGLSARGWSNADNIEGGSVVTRLQSTDVVFGTRAFESVMTGGSGQFGVAYDTGGTITAIFYRDYYKIVRVSSGQHKHLRTSATNCVTDDALTNSLTNDFGGVSQFQTQQGVGCGGATVTANPYATFITMNAASDVWYEREWYYAPGAPNTANGVWQMRLRRVSDGVEVMNEARTNVISYAAGETNRDRFLIIQNYFGNGFTNGTTAKMDDIRVQYGGQQRLYLANNATWASATQRQLQDIDKASSNSTNIRFRVQKGTLTTLTGASAFWVSSAGVVSSAYTPAGE